MVRGGLKITLALALAASAEAQHQFLRGFFGAGSGHFSSFSSSWSRGSDGRMHEEVVKMSSDDVATDYGMRHVDKKMKCKDGHCREEVMITAPMQPPPETYSMWNHPRVQAVLRFIKPNGQPMVVVARPQETEQMEPRPVLLTDAMPLPPQLLRGAIGGPSRYSNVVVRLPPPQSSAVATEEMLMDGVAGVGCFMMLVGLLGAMCHMRKHFASAREISGLAEPLAGADGAPKGQAGRKKAAKQPEPAAVAAKVTRGYLQGLYATAQASADRLAVGRYLANVYQRAVA